MKIYSLLFAGFFFLLLFSGSDSLRSNQPETGVVSITSSRENDIVTFELIGVDESKEVGDHLGKKQTPFKMTVSATDYTLLAHKLDGQGDMVVKFQVPNGNITTNQPITLIRKRGIALSSIGLGKGFDKL